MGLNSIWKEDLIYLMNEECVNINLEKMIRKVTKIAKEKYISNKAREERQLRIKTKKKIVKTTQFEKNDVL